MNEIENLLSKYFNDNKYFSALEELYILFEENSISIKDRKDILKQVYQYNKKIYIKEQNKITTLSNIKIKEEDIEMPIINGINEDRKTDSLNIDVSKYMADIRKCTSEEDLCYILPERDDPQFENIINTIIINLYKEKVQLINVIRLQSEDDADIQQLFEDELDNIDCIIELLLDYKNYIEEEIIEENNKLIFLKNSSYEPFIFQNLKGYEEYYDSFKELINRVKTGNFKHMRNFTSTNSKIVNVIEVKAFKTRVLFTRIKDNTYVILAAFVKKCNSDLRHRHFVEHVSDKFQIQKNELLRNLEKEEFLIGEDNWLEELNMMLTDKKKVKVHESN